MTIMPFDKRRRPMPIGPVASVVDGFRGYAFRLAAIGAMLLVTAMVGVTQWQFRQEALSTAQLEMAYFVAPVADNLGLLVESLDRGLINTRSQLSAAGAADRQGAATELYGDLARSLEYALIPANYAALDSAGRLIATSRQEDPDAIDLSDRDYFQYQAQASGDALFVGEAITNRLREASGERSLPFSRGEWDDQGRLIGVLVATIPANYLASYLAGRAFMPGASIAVLASDGTPLVSLVSDGVTRLAAADQPRDGARQDMITERAAIARSGLSLVASMPAEQALSVWWRGAWWSAAATAALSLILMGGALVLDRRGRAIDRVRADSHAVMANAFSGIQDPVILMDRDCHVVLYNDAAGVIGAPRDARVKIFEQFPWIQTHGYDALFLKAKSTQVSVSEEIYVAEFDRWFSLLIHPFKSGTVVYARDVTDAKKVSSQLHQAQKMEIIGQLAGGVAHDFNNLLTVIIGTLDSVVELSGDHPVVRADAQLGLRAAERAAELTASLLAIGRRQTLKPAVTDINAMLRDLLVLIRRTLTEAIEIAIVQQDDLWRTEIDPAKLEAAILNLVVNARDSMPEGGRICIETGNASIDDSYSAMHRDVIPGDYVLIAVTDAGSGMSAAVMDKAFEPFFSTKAEGKGTGLGLAMVLGFVKQSGGHVKIYSELGQGTTVKLYLPRSAQTPLTLQADDDHVVRGGSEQILLVEDDPMVRLHIAAMLRDLGYRHIEATTGPEALALLALHPVDLIVCDVTLPGGMTGKGLVDQAQAHYPHLHAIFISGYTREAIVHSGRLASGVRFLAKPFRKRDLAILLRQALDAASV